MEEDEEIDLYNEMTFGLGRAWRQLEGRSLGRGSEQTSEKESNGVQEGPGSWGVSWACWEVLAAGMGFGGVTCG